MNTRQKTGLNKQLKVHFYYLRYIHARAIANKQSVKDKKSTTHTVTASDADTVCVVYILEIVEIHVNV